MIDRHLSSGLSTGVAPRTMKHAGHGADVEQDGASTLILPGGANNRSSSSLSNAVTRLLSGYLGIPRQTEIVKSTAVPRWTPVPPDGFCNSTSSREIQSSRYETVPTCRPADSMAQRASASLKPKMCGTLA